MFLKKEKQKKCCSIFLKDLNSVVFSIGAHYIAVWHDSNALKSLYWLKENTPLIFLFIKQ